MTWFWRHKRSKSAPRLHEPPWITYGTGHRGWVVHLRTPSHDMGTSYLSADEARELGEGLLNYAEVVRLLNAGHHDPAAALAATIQGSKFPDQVAIDEVKQRFQIQFPS